MREELGFMIFRAGPKSTPVDDFEDIVGGADPCELLRLIVQAIHAARDETPPPLAGGFLTELVSMQQTLSADARSTQLSVRAAPSSLSLISESSSSNNDTYLQTNTLVHRGITYKLRANQSRDG